MADLPPIPQEEPAPAEVTVFVDGVPIVVPSVVLDGLTARIALRLKPGQGVAPEAYPNQLLALSGRRDFTAGERFLTRGQRSGRSWGDGAVDF